MTTHVAIVTGGNHGIGAAIARALAAQEVTVFITYLRMDTDEHDPSLPRIYKEQRAGAADAVVADIRAAGGRAEACEADLTEPEVPARLFDRAEAVFGPVDILVNNAAAWAADTFLADAADRFGRKLVPISAATHDHHFLVNSRAAALLIAEFARRHRARAASWGRIVSLTTGGAAGFPEEVSYGASKAALESYTRAAAWELGPFGITANVVSPPATDTGWVMPEVEAAVISGSPLRRVGQPEHVAEVVAFLVSDQAGSITGQTIRLN